MAMERIALECSITKVDNVYELGCGRGRCCFWLYSFIECSVVGIDHNPHFISRAEAVGKRFAVDIEFCCKNFLSVDYSEASVVYLYGISLDMPTILHLVERLKQLPRGARVVTVSYSLSDIDASFLLIKRFEAPFTWGEAEVYIQQYAPLPKG